MFDENENKVESSSYRYTPENPVYEAKAPVYPSEPTYSYRPDPAEPAPGKAPKAKKKGWTAGRVIALALVCALLGGCVGAGGLYLVASRSTTTESGTATRILQGDRPQTVLETAAIKTGKLMTAAEVYAANVNSTVGIKTSVTTTNFWGYATTGAASGSGFIMSADGYILTNQHVIEGSTSITVTTYDGSEYEATLVGSDESNDVALLKIDAKDLVPVVFGDSDKLNVGEGVVAIGNPLGELTFSLTSGVVSALNRTVTFSTGVQMDLIQTDCAINSGNSGGPLFNMYGEVIGITNSKYGSSGSDSIDNIGFAVPIDKARSIAESILENGYVAKPYIGVSTVTVSEEMQSYDFPKGAAIKEIVEGEAAEAAGLRINDIITAVDGEPITANTELSSAISKHHPGDVLTLSVFRQGEKELLSIKITVGEKKQAALQEEEAPQQQQQQQQQQRVPQQDQPSSPYYFRDPFDFFDFFGGF